MVVYCSDIPEGTGYPIFQYSNIWIGSPWERSGAINCKGALDLAMPDMLWTWFVDKHVRSEWTKRFT